MTNLSKDKNYIEWLKKLKQKFRRYQLKAAVKVNSGASAGSGIIVYCQD